MSGSAKLNLLCAILTALQVPLQEPADQQVPLFTKYLGDRRGIQGYQKSCYLDTTLFGLFALSDVFDEMFLEVFTSPTIDQNRKAISEVLWKGIVNPLRKYYSFCTLLL